MPFQVRCQRLRLGPGVPDSKPEIARPRRRTVDVEFGAHGVGLAERTHLPHNPHHPEIDNDFRFRVREIAGVDRLCAVRLDVCVALLALNISAPGESVSVAARCKRSDDRVFDAGDAVNHIRHVVAHEHAVFVDFEPVKPHPRVVAALVHVCEQDQRLGAGFRAGRDRGGVVGETRGRKCNRLVVGVDRPEPPHIGRKRHASRRPVAGIVLARPGVICAAVNVEPAHHLGPSLKDELLHGGVDEGEIRVDAGLRPEVIPGVDVTIAIRAFYVSIALLRGDVAARGQTARGDELAVDQVLEAGDTVLYAREVIVDQIAIRPEFHAINLRLREIVKCRP
ncbi:MAG: hypothetical protein BWY06_03337 [Candidatus Latescibacteria bacterium ADurb.Bin168]|nr:MAG: hypothetical protein BWY06_03337 [Candidatus Latescibacteria bacterium ADurb.Bin168]